MDSSAASSEKAAGRDTYITGTGGQIPVSLQGTGASPLSPPAVAGQKMH